MDALNRLFEQVRRAIALLIRRRGLTIAVLTSLAVGGLLLLALSAQQARMVSVSQRRLDRDELVAARKVLQQQDIPHRAEAGRVLVPTDSLAGAQAALAEADADKNDLVGAFQRLVDKTDLWTTPQRSRRRWLATKQTVLSRLISAMPTIHEATVILDSLPAAGRSRRGATVTAAVNVVLDQGQSLDQQTLAAIADQVCGSIAGMSREDVRIIDSSGQSYRAAHAAAAQPNDETAQLHAFEKRLEQKIRAALAHVGTVVISVHPVSDNGVLRCGTVFVSVPRSYLAAIVSPAQQDAPDERIQAVLGAQSPRIRQLVAAIASMSDLADVNVVWHHDAPTSGTVATASPSNPSRRTAAFALAAVLVAVDGVCALLLRWRAMRTSPADTEQTPTDDDLPPHQETDKSETPFDFLRDFDDDRLLEVLRTEHPQVVAMVLAQLSPSRAGAILAALDDQTQVRVARRIAGHGQLDRHLAGEVAGALAKRLSPPADGAAKVCEILRHGGYATQRNVLDAFAAGQSALAESIRRGMFVFDDIVRVSLADLRGSLKTVQGDDLAVALRTTNKKLKDRIFDALSPTGMKRVRRQMDRIGPVLLSDVEAAQQRVADAVHRFQMGQFIPTDNETPVKLSG